MSARLFLLATLVLAGCTAEPVAQNQPRERIFVRDPDKVMARKLWMIYEAGKAVASIEHYGTLDTQRYEGLYLVKDIRANQDQTVGKIDGNSGAITTFVGGMDRNLEQPTNEVVDVTTDAGLARAAQFLMLLQGNLEVVQDRDLARRAQ